MSYPDPMDMVLGNKNILKVINILPERVNKLDHLKISL